jgi:hypothetical protein
LQPVNQAGNTARLGFAVGGKNDAYRIRTDFFPSKGCRRSAEWLCRHALPQEKQKKAGADFFHGI